MLFFSQGYITFVYFSDDKSLASLFTSGYIMDNLGFFRAAAAVSDVALADPQRNALHICRLISLAAERGAEFVVFPELAVTGYSCADLFHQSLLLDQAWNALRSIAEHCGTAGIWAAVGLPVRFQGALYNCAAVISASGRIAGFVPKSHLPNYNEFYEKRWFQSGAVADGMVQISPDEAVPFAPRQIFTINGARVAVEICEDGWVPVTPGTLACLQGADIVANLSATDEMTGKNAYLASMLKSLSARCRCGYIYASAGWGESSTDLVFSGNAMILEDGVMLARSSRFSFEPLLETADIDVEKLRNDRRRFNSFSDISPFSPPHTRSGTEEVHDGALALPRTDLLREVDPTPFVPGDTSRLREHCTEIISIQAWGLARRITATGNGKVIVGISGGLDSTLALLVAAHAADMLGKPRTDIIGITMPGLATTSRTKSNAVKLMELLGVTSMEIPIAKAVAQHFDDLGHDPAVHDATFENTQARERTQILMDMANKKGGFVLGTGDLSELALGWCTYNGDQMSMYGVNASVPKTLVRYLVGWFAEEAAGNGDETTEAVLRDIIDTPISPELIPADDDSADTIAQKTEDLVGPYILHDFFLYHMLRNSFGPAKILALARKAFAGTYDDETLRKWLRNFYRRFFSQQFKRSCMPDGPKVGSVCLSPRGDWRMPSDASARMWLDQVEML